MTDFTSLDKKYIWHPFTNHSLDTEFRTIITRGEREFLFDDKGTKYIDLVSSWWVNLHGHAHPHISRAIYEQSKSLEQVIFASHITHPPAILLAEKLIKLLTPTSSLRKVFFSDNGSTATEVAIKLAFLYSKIKTSKVKKTILCFEGAYHGDTFGAMSVGASSGYFDEYKELLFATKALPYPRHHLSISDDEMTLQEQSVIDASRAYLDEHYDEVFGFILEPLVQGASGMRMCRPKFLNELLLLVKSYQIPIIFDEVMTGFGRTGRMFALEHLCVSPDILCLSKGITGGFLPLATTILSDEIFDTINSPSAPLFSHGHSYTANPLACAAALASLELFEMESSLSKVSAINARYMDFIPKLQKYNVKNIRVIGDILAFELDHTKNMTKQIREQALARGLFLRPLGNTIYLIPPYCIRDTSLDEAFSGIEKLIDF